MKRFAQQVLASLVALALIAVVGYGGILLADTLTIPYKTKSEGDTIYASHWTANFQSIEDVVNDLDDDNYRDAGMTGADKIIDGTVELATLDTDSVNSSKIVDETITSDDILNETLALVDYGDDTIDVTKTRGDYLASHIDYWTTSPGASFTSGYLASRTATFTTDAQSGIVEFEFAINITTCSSNEVLWAKITWDCGSGEADTGYEIQQTAYTGQASTLVGHFYWATSSTRSTSCTFKYYTKGTTGSLCSAGDATYFTTEWQLDT